MSIGTYLRCDRDICREERAIEPGKQQFLPEGWYQTFKRRGAFNDPERLHFCSGNCAYMFDFDLKRAEGNADVALGVAS